MYQTSQESPASISGRGSILRQFLTVCGRVGQFRKSAYESLVPSLTQSDKAFNYKLYIEDGQIGEERDLKDVGLKRTIEAARTAAIWRITNGNALP